MSIADAILRQIQQAGQPRTVTQTETVTGKEPVDIGSLGLLLYMLLQSQQKGLPTEPVGGQVSPFGGLQGMESLMPSFGAPAGAPSMGQGFGAMDPMQLIMKLIGAPRSPGLGGF